MLSSSAALTWFWSTCWSTFFIRTRYNITIENCVGKGITNRIIIQFLLCDRLVRIRHQKLNDHGVNHIYREFSGNHTCCVMTSTGEALEVFSNAMAFEMLVGVEPAGKLATTWAQIRRAQ